MPRLQPLPPETTPELKDHFDFFLGTLGFTPNSVLTMQRKPKLVQAGDGIGDRHLRARFALVLAPDGLFRRGVGCHQVLFKAAVHRGEAQPIFAHA